MQNKKRYGIISALLLLLIWQIAALFIDLDFILPYPAHVGWRMIELSTSSAFYSAVGMTVLRALFGLLCAFVSGTLLAFLSWRSPLFQQLFAPPLLLMRSVPNISYIIIIQFWFSRDVSSVIISFLILFPILYQTLLEALKALDPDYISVLRIYPKPASYAFFHVYLPLLRPAITAGLCNGIALSFKVGVMAEILGQVALGVGRQMQLARLDLDLTGVFAWTGWIVLFLFVSDRLMKYVVRFLCKE